jgi:hypothetical protein
VIGNRTKNPYEKSPMMTVKKPSQIGQFHLRFM